MLFCKKVLLEKPLYTLLLTSDSQNLVCAYFFKSNIIFRQIFKYQYDGELLTISHTYLFIEIGERH